MNLTETTNMHAGKRRTAALTLVALGFLFACGEPTAPVAPVAKATAPTVHPDASLVDITNGLLNVTNGVLTLVGNLLPCTVPTDQWNTASIGPKGGRLNIGPHQLVIPQGALRSQVQITAHAIRGNHVRVEFSPSGLQFSTPATLTLNYGVCKTNGKAVQVVYLKDDAHVTETEPSKDHPTNKSVEAAIRHFSSYAVAY